MRTWFMGKLAREKFILLIFVGALAVYWSSDLWARFGAAWREKTQTTVQLQVQEQWLMRREQIEGAARAAVEDLDSSRTFNSVRLSGELSTLAAGAGIATNLRSEAQPTQRTAQFSVHTVQLTLNRVPWENLLSFYEGLSQRAPYISIEQFTLESVRSDTTQLNARLLVSSVEISAR
ncbi:hypothetical protein [Synoicihabitans lomoniglobus]|uniref:Uncharacterized protein n=1 Tax=Synoicihabitans lomoniglobus TaxID=2909285 RepID=A0AAE9ZWQ9_9BACT|nr:hypothetical protein [Opitutaceae bacterium LMO-M01]WED65686.1 hypothetical protein PXH66_02350 [Opitutaceae bacterium LMO-M01]